MQPTKLRSQLQLLAARSVVLSALCAGAGAWVLAQQEFFSLQDPAAWLAGLCLAGALALPFVLASALARRLAAEIAEASGKLIHAAETARAREFALRSADRMKDEFLAMLGHELRNPLSAVSAAAYVLRLVSKDPDAQRSTQVIERQAGHMTRLIEDLLDVARVTRGKVSLSREPIDLAKVVAKAAEEMRLAGRLAQHELSLELGEAWVRADDARMQQVVLNLVGNAVKYTPAGGRIAVTLRRDRDQAILRVHDSGVGMSAELAARVFDLFVQGEVAERRAAGGLGIGLALVRHLAELHGGKAFAASSGPGQGSVFTVTLPAIEAQSALAQPPAAEPPQARHRILLVEDNTDARNSLFAALELHGHRVFEAADGRAGVRTAEALKPDVAIVDIGLPGIDGFEVASSLRDSPACERMVLIAVTGRDRPDNMRRAREAGFDEYLTKPVAPDRLVRLIDAAFMARARR